LFEAKTNRGIEFDAEHFGNEGSASEEAARSTGKLWGARFENVTDHFSRTTSDSQRRRPGGLKIAPPLSTLCVRNQDDDRVPLIVISNGEPEKLSAVPAP
jgi:hypothetical protein